MGAVWLARDEELGRRVALKILDDDAPDSLLAEARATARIQHPHIVTVYGVGRHEGCPFLVLEYVPGPTLRHRLAEERFAPDAAARVGAALAAALEAAHAAGVLHLDLKPENVIVAQDGRVRVVDFGIARVLGHGLQSTAGTPAYASPERWRGESPGEAADVWSLGVLLYELVEGARPFVEDEADRTSLARVVNERAAQQLSSLQVPARYADVVRACLSMDPADRPSAGEVREVLEALLPNRTVEGCPFPGLVAYRERDAATFFGRSREVGQLAHRLRKESALAVVGASGAGKSSLVFAGLVPRLREQASWRLLELRPGSDPMATLDVLLEAITEETRTLSTEAPLEGDNPWATAKNPAPPTPATLHLRLLELAQLARQRVLLVVDQLEELYTLCADPTQREAFMDALAHCADAPDDPVRLVVTVRDDFLGQLAWERPVLVLRPPGPQALRGALTEAFAAARYEAPEVVARLVESVRDEPAPLPLLQFTARLLWDERDVERRTIPLEAFESLGGVGGVLATRADEVLSRLPPGGREVARQLLLRLITEQGTRRPLPRERALAGLGEVAEPVLEQLTAARLLVQSQGPSGTQVDLAHETLIHAWSTLNRWLYDARAELRHAAHVEDAAALWAERTHDESGLLGKDALRQVEGLQHTALSPRARAYVEASRARIDAREAQAVRVRRRVVGGSVAVAAAATLAAIVLARAETEASQARDVAEEAEARAVAANAGVAWERGEALLARAQLRSALETADVVEARALWETVRTAPLQWRRVFGQNPSSIHLSPDGRHVVVAEFGGGLVRLDTITAATEQLMPHDDTARWVRIGPDGAVYTVGMVGDVRVLRDGEVQWRPVPGEGRHQDLVIDREGTPWGLHYADGVSTVWRSGPGGETSHAVAPPAHSLIAVSGDRVISASRRPGEVTSWVLDDTGALLPTPVGEVTLEMRTDRLALSPDGRLLLLAGQQLVVQDLETGERRQAQGARNIVWASIDDAGVARALDADGGLHHWVPGHAVRTQPFDDAVNAQESFGRGDALLVVVESEVRFLNTAAAGRRDAHVHQNDVLALHGSGPVVLSGDAAGTVTARHPGDGTLAWHLDVHEAQINAIDQGFGRMASASDDGSAAVFDASGVVVRLPHRRSVLDIAIASEDRLLTVDWGGGVHLWQLDPEHVAGYRLLQTIDLRRNLTGIDVANGRIFVLEYTGALLEATLSDRIGPLVERARTPGPAYLLRSAPETGVAVVLDTPGKVRRLDADSTTLLTESSGMYGPIAANIRAPDPVIAWMEGDSAMIRTGDAVTPLALQDPDVKQIDLVDGTLLTASAGGAIQSYGLDDGRPRWRGGLIDDQGLHATAAGWRDAEGALVPQTDAWRAAVVDAAVADRWNDVLCIHTGRELQLWRIDRDERVASLPVDTLQVEALPEGCQAGSVRLEADGPQNGPVRLASNRRSFAVDDGRLLGDDIQTPPLGTTPTAIWEADDELWVGDRVGRVGRVTGDGVDWLPLQGNTAVRLLHGGPRSTMIVGFADGDWGMYETDGGRPLFRGHLDGAVRHASLHGERLTVTSDLGRRHTQSLAALDTDRCALLAEIQEAIPVRWDRDRIVQAAPTDCG
jgi:hypothetical protein